MPRGEREKTRPAADETENARPRQAEMAVQMAHERGRATRRSQVQRAAASPQCHRAEGAVTDFDHSRTCDV
jgi:hypothetical protein